MERYPWDGQPEEDGRRWQSWVSLEAEGEFQNIKQDVITEVSGTKWTVQQATEISIGATSIKWRCICVKQRA